MAILDGESDKFGRHRAEFHGLRSHALGSLPELRILQFTAAHRSNDLRHDARFKLVVKDVSTREGNAAGAGSSQLGNVTIETRHMIRRIACPALASDILIKSAVPVCHDVQAGAFLLLE